MEGEIELHDLSPQEDPVISDDDYNRLIPNDDVDATGLYRKLRQKYRDVPSALRTLSKKWLSRNPGRRPPAFLDPNNYERLEEPEESYQAAHSDLRVRVAMEIRESVREQFPSMKDALLDFQINDDGKVQVRNAHSVGTWYNLYQKRDPSKINGQLPKGIKDALGKETLILQQQAAEADFDEATQSITIAVDHINQYKAKIEGLNETLQEREEEYQKQYRLLQQSHGREKEQLQESLSKQTREKQQLRAERDKAAHDLAATQEELHQKQITLNGAIEERRQIAQQINTLEGQIRQREQAIEDLERHVEEQRETIADQRRPAEEIAAAERKKQELEEQIEELSQQLENKRRELGLTTKEKIKRALLKYGIPVAFAVAIAGTVAAIMSALKGVGAGVKKLGAGLTELGKKMAASVPGLLGSVLSLVLKTGGELLKFVGNNIWILVVAIGAILLKKLKI